MGGGEVCLVGQSVSHVGWKVWQVGQSWGGKGEVRQIGQSDSHGGGPGLGPEIEPLRLAVHQVPSPPHSPNVLPTPARPLACAAQVYSKQEHTHIQDVVAADAAGLPAPGSLGVLLCGHKGMVEAVKSVLAKHGVEQDKMLLNF